MAIDSLGRYQLVTMRDRIRRILDGYQQTVDQTTGAGTILLIQDQSISNDDINDALNESLTGLYGEMFTAKEAMFAQSFQINIGANNAGPYGFPPQTIQVRWLKWLASGSDPSLPESWLPMALIDDAEDYAVMQDMGVPTWRWEGGQFMLNESPSQSGTILANVVLMPKELSSDTDVINVPQMVRILQQAVIYDTAFTLCFSKHKQITEEIGLKRTEWHNRLQVMTQNAYITTSMQLTNQKKMIRNTFSGRKNSVQ